MWHNKECFTDISEKTYSLFIERFKETPRPINPKTENIIFFLKLFHELHVNITILGFHLNNQNLKKCNHKSKKCYSIIYKYLNYNSSLINPNTFPNLIFCEYDSNVFLVHRLQNITPLLTLIPPNTEIQINEQIVTKNDILNILHHQTEKLDIPFSIALYSSYQFIPRIKKWTPQNIQKTYLIRYYENRENNKTLHLLLSPYLYNYDFSIHILPENQTKNINIKNNLPLKHTPEGIYHPMLPHNSSSVTNELNETFCICQHPDTQMVPIEKPKQYSHLGKSLYMCLIFHKNCKNCKNCKNLNFP